MTDDTRDRLAAALWFSHRMKMTDDELTALQMAMEDQGLLSLADAPDAETPASAYLVGTAEWARWIVRQGRNPQPGCPECGPLGMGQPPKQCVPHQALAALRREPTEEGEG